MLARVGMASVVCEKKALFALCQVIQEKSVDIVLVSKVQMCFIDGRLLHHTAVTAFIEGKLCQEKMHNADMHVLFWMCSPGVCACVV